MALSIGYYDKEQTDSFFRGYCNQDYIEDVNQVAADYQNEKTVVEGKILGLDAQIKKHDDEVTNKADKLTLTDADYKKKKEKRLKLISERDSFITDPSLLEQWGKDIVDSIDAVDEENWRKDNPNFVTEYDAHLRYFLTDDGKYHPTDAEMRDSEKFFNLHGTKKKKLASSILSGIVDPLTPESKNILTQISKNSIYGKELSDKISLTLRGDFVGSPAMQTLAARVYQQNLAENSFFDEIEENEEGGE
jgi:hypothetical protein